MSRKKLTWSILFINIFFITSKLTQSQFSTE